MATIHMWALMTPKGKILKHTVSPTRSECWEASFWTVSDKLGTEWHEKFWKRWNPSIRSARAHGYKMCRVMVIPQVIP